MMLRAGHLDKTQLQAVQARSMEGKMSFVAAVVELGYVQEDSIVAFLHSKLMIPKLGGDALSSVSEETRAKITGELARKHVVLPVGTDDAGNLTLAMSDPTDMKAVDAISGHTGAYLVRAVAPHSALLAAIDRCYPKPKPVERKPAPVEPKPAPVAAPTPAPAPVAAPVPVAAPAPAPVPAPVAAPVTSPVAPPVAAPPVTSPVAPPVAAPPVTSPVAPPVAAPPVTSPVAPPVAAPPVSAPSVGAPSIAAPPSIGGPPSVGAPLGAPPVAAPPVAAPPVAAPPVAAPPVAAPPVAAPPVAAPPVAAPPVAAPPVAAPPVAAPPVAAAPPAAAPTAAAAPPSSAADNGIAPPPAWAGADGNEQQVELTRANVTPLSAEAFSLVLPKIASVKSRTGLTDLLLDFLVDGFVRVIMFVHSKGEIRGHDARGEDLMIEAVRQIRIPATGPSLFSEVIERKKPYVGQMRTSTAIDTAFDAALGGVEGNILVLPITLRGRVPVIVFAATARFDVDQGVVDQLAFQASAAFERLIVAAKRG
jgi:hypothetical protein